jgi:hypothetical protein
MRGYLRVSRNLDRSPIARAGRRNTRWPGCQRASDLPLFKELSHSPTQRRFDEFTIGKTGGMIKKLFATAIFAGLIGVALPASAQVVYVQVAPPAPIVETVPVVPGPGYVWVGGHYTWNGNRYVWLGGHYIRHGGHWCEGGWRHEYRGYRWADGHWC